MRQKMVDELVAVEVPACGVGRKSMYHKALEICTSMGYKLISYATKVARIEVDNGKKLVRLWDGYSDTNMRHVNAWLQWHGMNTITKKQWQEMEVAR